MRYMTPNIYKETPILTHIGLTVGVLLMIFAKVKKYISLIGYHSPNRQKKCRVKVLKKLRVYERSGKG